jgi:hypothetical protein
VGWGYYNVWLRLARSEPPYLAAGCTTAKFELFGPRRYVFLPSRGRWLKGLAELGTAALSVSGQASQFVTEWRMEGREAGWSSMQGMPIKNAKRLYAVEE